jgi:exopolyphosphatase/guanosine-5'-triphosphate,3'-diphosphate pyrophosphatase
MKRLASIDIGSNTILLLVAKIYSDGRIKPLLQDSRTPRLAFGLKKSGFISDENLKRAIKDIKSFKKKAHQHGAENIYAVATQAVRSAKNKAEVVEKIKNETGIPVEVISGKREAELTYLGAVTGIKGLKPNRIMFDIGGASSEFVMTNEDDVTKAVSLEIGAVEITEKYGTDQKCSPKTLKKASEDLRAFFKRRLKGFRIENFDLIGTGGTISTFKLLDSKPPAYDPDKIHGKSLKLNRLEELINDLAGMKLSERKRVITFEPSRAEVIVAGGLILRSLLRYFDSKSLKVSTRNLRWGFLISKL